MTTISAVSGRAPDQILARQRAAFLRDGPPSFRQRRADLKKLRAALLARRVEIERSVDADFGHRSRHETAAMETMTLLRGIDYLHRNLRRFMASTHRHVALTFRFASPRIEYQPLGVIGIVAPWNYPLAIALMPLATAIAAGNRAMLKPSTASPLGIKAQRKSHFALVDERSSAARLQYQSVSQARAGVCVVLKPAL
jgi:coniferyl-aldehyde dehydrogenase